MDSWVMMGDTAAGSTRGRGDGVILDQSMSFFLSPRGMPSSSSLLEGEEGDGRGIVIPLAWWETAKEAATA